MLNASFAFYMKCLKVYVRYKLKRYSPFLIIINPTKKCNLKCEYCSSWKSTSTQSISSAKLFELIDEIAKMGVPYVSFSGGEPLLIPKIEDISAYAKVMGVYTNLNTNGTLITKKRAEKIANSFSHIRISLDGLGKVHDRISGIDGTYEKVKNAIDNLSSISNRTVKIGINVVLNKADTSQLANISQAFQDKVDFITYLPRFSFKHSPQQCRMDMPFEVMQNQTMLSNNHKSGNTRQFMRRLDLEYSRKNCDAGRLYCSILSDGQAYAYPFLPDRTYANFRLGSIYEEGLFEILEHKKDSHFSAMCRGCYATCTTEVSRIFRMSPIQLMREFPYLKDTYKL